MANTETLYNNSIKRMKGSYDEIFKMINVLSERTKISHELLENISPSDEDKISDSMDNLESISDGLIELRGFIRGVVSVNDSKNYIVGETSIKVTELSTRTKHALLKIGVKTVKDLLLIYKKNEIGRIRNIGESSVVEIRRFLERGGLV